MSDQSDTIKAQVLKIWGALTHARGIFGIIKAVPSVVASVEAIAAAMSGMTGSAKREAVVDILSDAISLPLWFAPFKRTIIGWLVDMTVFAWNTLVGHQWIDTYIDSHPVFGVTIPKRTP